MAVPAGRANCVRVTESIREPYGYASDGIRHPSSNKVQSAISGKILKLSHVSFGAQ